MMLLLLLFLEIVTLLDFGAEGMVFVLSSSVNAKVNFYRRNVDRRIAERQFDVPADSKVPWRASSLDFFFFFFF